MLFYIGVFGDPTEPDKDKRRKDYETRVLSFVFGAFSLCYGIYRITQIKNK
jgi:hypothetical protein